MGCRNQLSKMLLGVTLTVAATGCTSFRFAEGSGGAPKALKSTENMARLSGGQFEMGAHAGDPHEFPPHQVTVDGFYLDKLEVTNKDYQRCVKAETCGAQAGVDEAWLETETLPAVGVTWYGAQSYCRWVGKRLPTEAEWEYAARRPDGRTYPWGEASKKEVYQYANLRGDADGADRLSDVVGYEKGHSDDGISQMAGNAAEWVSDWFSSTYYEESPAANPKGPDVSTGRRSVRGGSWSSTPYNARANARDSEDPNRATNAIGFRCAKD